MKTKLKIFALLIMAIGVSACSSVKNASAKREQKVEISTTEGVIVVKLYNSTPLHRDNFVKLVKSGVYQGVLFHRVIADFMIQGGDPQTRSEYYSGKNKADTTDFTIPAEFRTPHIYHKKGALAAARMGDRENPSKASSGFQFYIVKGKKFTDADLDKMQTSKIAQYQKLSEEKADSLYKFSERARADYKTIGGTPHLDGNYTVFGEVIKGIEVVDKISVVKTNKSDKPLQDVRVLKMKLVR